MYIDILSDYANLKLYLEPGTIKYEANIIHYNDAYLRLPEDKHDPGLTTKQKTDDEYHTFFETGKKKICLK